MKFVVGGFLVALATALGETRYRFLSGLAVLFPAVTITGYYFLGRTTATPEMREIVLFSVLGLSTLLAFLAAFYLALGRFELGESIAVAMVAWCLTAGLLIVFNTTVLQLGL